MPPGWRLQEMLDNAIEFRSDVAFHEEPANDKANGWQEAAEITPKDVAFLWNNRFVANRINIVAGMGDVGKDVLCCTVAACITTGRKWPAGSPGCEPGIVGIISPEDDPDDTIVPRLMAAACDTNKVRIWTADRRPIPEEISDLKALIVSPLINLMDKKAGAEL